VFGSDTSWTVWVPSRWSCTLGGTRIVVRLVPPPRSQRRQHHAVPAARTSTLTRYTLPLPNGERSGTESTGGTPEGSIRIDESGGNLTSSSSWNSRARRAPRGASEAPRSRCRSPWDPVITSRSASGPPDGHGERPPDGRRHVGAAHAGRLVGRLGRHLTPARGRQAIEVPNINSAPRTSGAEAQVGAGFPSFHVITIYHPRSPRTTGQVNDRVSKSRRDQRTRGPGSSGRPGTRSRRQRRRPRQIDPPHRTG